ncbi:hypothetical protein H8F21_15170 [Pseudomonas sp. P66]|uniref:Response regulatory domain-containing protein n=1 Tax=Pseudomonas arcuscaelestis TaxID=2710591 RepID=A0ABS2BZ60_9PSED|nr:hypothetical protein [Pseudomonas arcuscaelestis]MBM5458906.1 hypothetical protein [Pseudomonas arcuscaelestis]
MATALILTDDASEAFNTQQILCDLFDKIRACNTVVGALKEMADSKPDLVIVLGLQGFSGQPLAAAAQVIADETPTVLMCAGLQVVGRREPARSVRVVPPLNLTNTFKAIHELGLAGIVKQTSLYKNRRPGD